ncbi:MAG: hypothetical protein ACXWQO_19175, partial [Bdellovibrionota bacterium]
MKTIALLSVLASLTSVTSYAAEAAPTPKAEEPKKAEAAEPAKKVEAVDISDLEENYWRPNQDELEVLQNRKYEKAHRFELGVHYGIYQGKDYVNSKSTGVSATYNFSNVYFVELSHHRVSNTDNEFLSAIRTR